MSERLRAARTTRAAAEKQLLDILKADYPLDQPIKWRRAGRTHQGRVHRPASYFDRLQVRNDKTHKTSWITSYDIVEAMAFAHLDMLRAKK